MKYPLTIKLPKQYLDLDLNGTTPRQIIADINAFEGVTPVYNEDTKKSEYTFNYIKQDMLSEAAFMALTQVPGIEAEGVILYVVVNNILDWVIPESFPINVIKDDKNNIIGRQTYGEYLADTTTVIEGSVEQPMSKKVVTFADYFDVRYKDDDKIVLCLRYKRLNQTSFESPDYPDIDTFKLFYSVIATEIIQVNGISLLSEKGANDYISENYEKTM